MVACEKWDLVLFWPRSKTEVSIPYSAFLAELRTDNVTRVHIVGASITGAFAKPVLWPEQKKSQASEQRRCSKTASPTPSATKAQQHSTPAHPFSAFETTFPATVGDPNLIALLESHHVLVDVSPPVYSLAPQSPRGLGPDAPVDCVFLVDGYQCEPGSSRNVRLRPNEGSPLFQRPAEGDLQ